MYSRLISRSLPGRVLLTENEYEISADKSCVLIKGEVVDGQLQVGPIATTRHAAQVYRNPALGHSFQIITPDDGPVELNAQITKKRLEEADALAYHYKVFINLVDVIFRD